MGICSSAGVCEFIWGTDIYETALGDPPVRTHPAFITFIILMTPFMIICVTGVFFLLVVPIFSKFHIRVLDSPQELKTIRKICRWFIKHLENIIILAEAKKELGSDSVLVPPPEEDIKK
ncbi:MAG: hypothetical protein FVQ85_18740 [Planctomycetes bacterium]|nr:hypothetical protein [Planctomycetota bacterium]